MYSFSGTARLFGPQSPRTRRSPSVDTRDHWRVARKGGHPGLKLLMALGISLAPGCTLLAPPRVEPLNANDANSPAMAEVISLDSFDAARLSDAIFRETNQVRRQLGLRPFTRLNQLDRAADIQASSNALGGAAIHGNLIHEWATPFDRVVNVGLRPNIVSENAAMLPLLDFDVSKGYYERKTPEGTVIVAAQTGRVAHAHTYASFAQAIVRAWMNSPEHRANIVNPRLRVLGCSARPTKTVTGFDMIAGIQVFYTPSDR